MEMRFSICVLSLTICTEIQSLFISFVICVLAARAVSSCFVGAVRHMNGLKETKKQKVSKSIFSHFEILAQKNLTHTIKQSYEARMMRPMHFRIQWRLCMVNEKHWCYNANQKRRKKNNMTLFAYMPFS